MDLNKIYDKNIKIIKINKTDMVLYDMHKNNFYYTSSNSIYIPQLKKSKSI